MKKHEYTGIQCSRAFSQKQKDTMSALCERMNVSGPINESILSDMRKTLDLMRKEDDIFDEKALDNIQDIMKSASKFSAYLMDNFGKSWDKILSFYKSGFDKAKTEVMGKIKSGQFDFPKDNIGKEMEELRNLSVFWLKDFRPVLLGDIKKKYSQCLLGESMEVNADFVLVMLPHFDQSKLNEGKDPWTALDRANKAINGTEPFGTINKIADIGVGNSSLNKFATLSADLGGPKCGKISCLGAVGSKLASVRGKGPSYEEVMAVNPVLRFMPGGKSLVEIFEHVAMITVVLEIAAEISKK